MAIVEFINKPNKSYAGMKNVIKYVLKAEKTSDKITTGIGLNPANAFNEMVTLKQIMGKTDKRLWYHFVQSFPPYDNITPELAQKVALETAEYFKEQYQILIAVHIDKNHIHTHFVLNTVNIETGKKYTQNNAQRLEIQTLSDKICEKYGLHTLSDEQKNNRKYKKTGQYRAEQSGKGWKLELKNTIDDVLSTVTSKADFIHKMEQRGYQVKWTDTRESITFTTSKGLKCRDKRLDDPSYYNKATFEMIFEQNSQSLGQKDKSEEKEMPLNSILQGFSDISGLFSDDEFIAVRDGFMLQDIDFDGMSWQEVERTIARLRREAEIRALRAMDNQTEQKKKVRKQAFKQCLTMLDDFEDWLYERKFGSNDNDYQLNCEDENEDEWER